VAARNESDNTSDELKAEFASLREDISRITETLQRLSGEQVEEGRKRTRQAADRTRERVNRTVNTVEGEIQHYPLTSLATAFGVGFIVGKLLDR
jgi:ElaB/YqjD/DUF883 family membrane-anchored ribosome-binding protein